MATDASPAMSPVHYDCALDIERPTRGAVRWKHITCDPERLQADLQLLEQAVDWTGLPFGSSWSEIVLLQDNYRHPLLDRCPAIAGVIERLPSRALDACLKQLSPGGAIPSHRDITGGSPMGVMRVHIPIRTHQEVQFYVNERQLCLGLGDVWLLDTSYRHRAVNRSDVSRVHLVVDLELDDALQALLPPRDGWDRLHDVFFWFLCCWKGLTRLGRPRALAEQIVAVIRLRVFRRSAL